MKLSGVGIGVPFKFVDKQGTWMKLLSTDTAIPLPRYTVVCLETDGAYIRGEVYDATDFDRKQIKLVNITIKPLED